MNGHLSSRPLRSSELISCILLRLRQELITISADIEAMLKFKWRFPKKTNLYCVLFREHRKTKWTCTNMLGTSLERSVPRHGLTYRGDEKQTAQDNKDSFPLKVEVVERSFYMDDSLKSVPSLLEACSLQAGLVNLLSLGVQAD